MAEELKHKDITHKIIGAAFQVHSFLGCGFQEVIYQRALAHELEWAGLNFAREVERHIHYKHLEDPIGTRRADFLVEDKVIVEIKAVTELEDAHMAQALNYLRIFKLEIGLLINFGAESLTFKRLIMTQK